MPQPTTVFDRAWGRGARDFFLSLSLANLAYYPVWDQLVNLPDAYFGKEPPPSIAFAAAWFSVLLLTLVTTSARLLPAIAGSGRLRDSGRWITPAVWLLPLSFFISSLSQQLGASSWLASGAQVALILGTLGLSIRWPSRVLHAAEIAALIFIPFVVVTAGQSLWWLSGGDRSESPARPSLAAMKPMPTKPVPRIVWIVMDEFDYRLAFDARPAGIALPALDRLREEAFFATQARPPAWRTLLSIPAMINGERVIAADPISRNELGIYLETGEDAVSWSKTSNLFTRARKRGLNVSVVGFYHPYCELFSKLISECTVADFFTRWDRRNFSETLGDQWAEWITRIPVLAAPWNALSLPHWGSARKVTFLKETLLELHETLMRGVRQTLDRQDLQLQLIHLAVPHPPGIYDRRENKISLAADANYIDNLELADRVLGQIRADAEKAGIWEDTTWILTSDHWWKSEFWKTQPGWTEEEESLATGETDQRVPFFVKIAGATDTVEYPAPLEIVIIPRLIEALWDGSIKSHQELSRWLLLHPSREEKLGSGAARR
jgi:hypothetical protein